MLPKIRITWKKAWNKSCSELNFVQKNLRAHMSTFPRSGARGSKYQYVWYLIMYRNGNLGSLYGSTLSKIRITWKKLEIKVVRNLISSKKVRERIFRTTYILSFFPGDAYFWQHWALKCMYLPFLYSIIFQPYQSFELPAPFWGRGDRHMRSGPFWEKFNFEPLLFWTFFHVMHFLTAVSHKVNLKFRFYTL